jgi:Undecaprenyl-phosphate glucose phosphotransferase
MSYASFTNLPGSSKFPAASLDVGKELPAALGKRRRTALLVSAVVSEFLLVAIAAYLAAFLYHRLILLQSPDPGRYIPEALLIATLNLLVSVGHRQYGRIQTQPWHVFLRNGISGVFLVFFFLLSTMFVLKHTEDYSRATVIAQALCVGLAVLFTRATWFSLLHRATASGLVDARRVILIGDPDHCSQFSAQAMATGIRTVRSFTLPTALAAGPVQEREGPPAKALADARQLIADCRPLRADDIIILTSQQEIPSALALASGLSELPVDVHIVPAGSLELLAMTRITEFGNMVTMRILQSPITPFNRAVKRAFDIVAATAGLILLSPVFAIVSLAIKFDSSGPVLFRQMRHGYNNEPICVLKFRSMSVMEAGSDFTQVTMNDPRVTRLGRFLRRTNIDELPQLINVLAGDMSIVGPRPHATAQNEAFAELISSFFRRHNVKPGMTGWAQVNGYRGNTNTLEKMQRRVEHDLYYIDHWSFLFDLRIILLTAFSRAVYVNAY